MDTTHRSSFSSPSVRSQVKGVTQLKKTQLALAVSALVAGLGGIAAPAFAGPEGGVITGGSGTIDQSGNTTVINQTTDLLAIDWNSFDVGVDETVQYIQPDASSVSLNRILSNNGSVIQGQIDANGQVILVNPHGIIFTATSVINAGGILASGLTIDTSEFMNGDFAFEAVEGTDGVVINSGLLNAATGGSVNLLGKKVINDGLIQADLGRVSLAAGNAAVVSFDADGLIGITVTESVLQEELGIDPAILNEGDISAAGGKVLISAAASRDIFSAAVNTDDLRQATSVVMDDDGGFTLSAGANVVNAGNVDVSVQTASNNSTANNATLNTTNGGSVVILGENIEQSGTVTASSVVGDGGSIEIHSVDTTLIQDGASLNANSLNADAGDIKVLGNNVGLLADTTVDATGATNGGEVLIGGDYRGENTLIPTATAVYFDHEATIIANATESGSAGKVILWGDDSLKAYGDISAAGFGLADGGFVETSAGVVNLDLFVNTSAEAGEGGEWLVDPYNIIIDDNGGSLGIGNQFTSSSSQSTITIDSIKSGFSNFGTIIIETGANTDPEDGNITLNTDFDFDSIGSGQIFILNAHNDIILNGQIYDSNTNGNDSLNLILNADFDSNGSGSIDINNTIELNGGDFIASGVNFDLGSQDAIELSSIDTDGGEISLFMSGDISIYDDINTNNGDFVVSGDYDNDFDNSGDIFYQANSFSSYFAADEVAGTSEVIATILTDNNEVTIDAAIVNLGQLGNSDDNVGDVEIINTAGTAMTVSLNGDIYSRGNNNDNVTITGTGSGDTVIVSGQVFNQTLDINSGGGADVLTFDSVNTLNVDTEGNIDTININASVLGVISGGTGSDTFNISASTGTTLLEGSDGSETFNILSAGISAVIDAGGQANNNTDTIVGFDGVNTWNISSQNDGSLMNDGGTISFVGIENLQGGSDSDTFNIDARLDSTNNSGFVQGSINGGEGSDIFNITTTDFSDGNDTTVTLAISGGVDVDNDDVDIFDFGVNSNAEWLITGTNEGTLNTNVSFNQVETLNGSDDGNDTFDIEFANADVATTLGRFAGSIDGRDGDDTIELIYSNNGTEATDAVIDVNTISNIEYLEGNGNATQLSVIGIENTITMWEILDFDNGDGLANGVNDGRITYGQIDNTSSTEFIDIGNVVGTAGIDTFTVTGSIVSIDGGEGVNTLTGNDIANTWIVSSANGGSLADENNTAYVTNFSNIDALVGGDDVDTFILNSADTNISLDGGNRDIDTVRVNHTTETQWALGDTDVITVMVTDTEGTVNTNSVTLQNIEIGEGSDDAEDTFTINSASTDFDILRGRGEDDEFVITTAALPIITLEGNDDNDSLSFVGVNNAITWTLGDTQTVTAASDDITFETIESLIGSNTEADTFNYSVNPTHTITAGGSDGDILSVAGVGGDVTLMVNNNGIERYVGNQDGSDSTNINSTTLTFSSNTDEDVNWLVYAFDTSVDGVDGINDGDITNTTTSETIQFVNVNNLTGGVGNDTFDFTDANASITGTINGADGSNTITAKDVATEWNIDVANGGAIDADSADRFVNIFRNIQTINAGALADTFNIAGSIVGIDGGDGSDTFTINNAALNAILTGGVDADGLDTDELTLGLATNDGQWLITETNAGTLNNDIDFSEFETLNGSDGGNDTFDFEFADATDNDVIGSFDGTIDARGGNDIVELTFDSIIDIALILSDVGIHGVANSETIKGNGDGTTLLVTSINQVDWIIAGDDNDTDTELNGINDGSLTSDGKTISFLDIGLLEGSAVVDTFNITGSIVEIDGGDGSDTFTVNNAALNATLTSGIDVDGLDMDELTLGLTANDGQWLITSTNAGTLNSDIGFSGFEILNGSDGGNDTFDFEFADATDNDVIGSFDGTIDARGGNDIVELTFDSIIDIALNLSDVGIHGVANSETIKGNGDGTTLLVTSINQVDWIIAGDDNDTDTELNGINDGSLTSDGKTISFLDIGLLEGSAVVDTFNITGSIVEIDGGDGSDTFTVNNATLNATLTGGLGADILTLGLATNDGQWLITETNAGTLNNDIDFSEFERLNGSDGGNDTFDFEFADATDNDVIGSFDGTIDARGGNDIVELTFDSIIDIALNLSDVGIHGVANSETIKGNGDDTTLLVTSINQVDWIIAGDDNDNDTELDGINDGSLTIADDMISFLDIGLLEGSDVVDTFNIIGSIVEIDGGDGSDIFTVNNAALNATLTGGVDVGGLDIDVVTAAEGNNAWVTSGVGAGTINTILSFNGMESLIGNSGMDTFALNHSQNMVDGAGGDDIYNIGTSGISVTITDTGTNGSDGINAFDDVINDTVWTIDGTGDSYVNNAGIVAYSGIEVAEGSSGVDEYTISRAISYAISSMAGADEFILQANATGIINAGADNDSFRIDSNSLTIASLVGGDGTDTITFNNTADGAWNIDGMDAGTLNTNIRFSQTENITGGTGNDIFTIENSGVISGTLSGGAGDGIDEISGRTTASTFTITGEGTGSLIDTNADPDETYVVAFENINILRGNSSADTIVSTGDGIIWNLRDDTVGNESDVNSVKFTGMELFEAGAGADIFNIYADIGTVDGKDGGDTYNILTSGIDATINDTGNTGSDSLNAFDDSNTTVWTIDGTDTYANNGGTVAFDGIEAVEGSGGVDEFTISSAINYDISSLGGEDKFTISASTGLIDGGEDSDTYTIAASAVNTTLNDSGSIGSDSLNAFDDEANATIWTINGLDSYSNNSGVVNYSGMESIEGSSGIDTFTITDAISYSINSMAGNDVFVFNASATGDIDAGAGSDSFRINSDELIISSLSGGDGDVADSDTLTFSAARDASWIITSENTGTLNIIDTSGTLIEVTDFNGIENLTGSASADTFTISDAGSITGTIDGGTDSNNILQGRENTNTSWDLGTEQLLNSDDNSAYVNDFTNIQTLIGRAAIDRLQSASGTNTWEIDEATGGDINGLSFSGFNVLLGRGEVDTFNITANNNLTIFGNDGVDIFNIDANSGSLNGGNGADIFTVTDLAIIADLNGNNGNDILTLNTGSAQNTATWVIDDDSTIGSSLNETITFSNFRAFNGDAGTDNFNVARGSDLLTINGGGGTDTLTLASNAGDETVWNITGENSGTVSTDVDDFISIENITAGAGDDEVIVAVEGSLSGLFDAGESDGDSDTLNLTAFVDGIVVELGAGVNDVIFDPEINVATRINVDNFEEITAASGDGENTNWLAIRHADNVRFDISTINQGSVFETDAEGNDIASSETAFSNFGSFQGGSGSVDSNINAGGNITGEYREGTGMLNLNYSGLDTDQVILVDITGNLESVTGNNNVLLRASSDGDFNDDNAWTIYAENTGTFASIFEDEAFELSFSGVNQLQGGTGNDTFTFTDIGDLTNGSIYGGGGIGVDTIMSTATTELTFGINQLNVGVLVNSPRDGDNVEIDILENRDNVIDILGITELIGNAAEGINTQLMSADSGDFTWNILAAGSDSTLVNNTDPNAAVSMIFENIDTVIGGEANDIFMVTSLDVVANTYDGGGGNDELNLSAITEDLVLSLDASVSNADVILAGMETLTLSAANNRLYGFNSASTWTLTDENTGTLVYSPSINSQQLNFSNVAHLMGNAAQDDFVFSSNGSLTGSINGGQSALDSITVTATSSLDMDFQLSDIDGNGNVIVSDDIGSGEGKVDFVNVELIAANGTGDYSLFGAASVANTWALTSAANTLTSFSTSGEEKAVTFNGINNLYGGAGQDIFTLDGVSVTGIIDGGSNLANVGADDTLTVSNLADSTVHIGDRVTEDINIVNIESITNQSESATLRGDDIENTWNINTADGGLLNDAITFAGFTALVGGSNADVFDITAANSISHFDGGAAPTIGSAFDRLTFADLMDTGSMVVSLDQGYENADMYIANLNSITGSALTNTLVGTTATNDWFIEDNDSGRINGVSFSGFGNLIGRNGVDTFSFLDLGVVSGFIDGGAQPEGTFDTVDLSELTSTINVVVGDTLSGFINIEQYIGNNRDAQFTAADFVNIWTIDDENSGSLTYTDSDSTVNTIVFSGFDMLTGGSLRDEFTLDNLGSVTGSIDGGAGNDALLIDLASGRDGEVAFYGGEGTNTITLSGGSNAERFDADYQPLSDGSALLDFTRESSTFSVNYNNVATLNNDVFIQTLTVAPVVGADNTMTLSGDDLIDIAVIDNTNDITHTVLSNSETNSITIDGDASDTVVIDGAVELANTLTLNDVLIDFDAQSSIQANTLIFDRTGSIGSAEQRLTTEIQTLELMTINGDSYLNNNGDLAIAALTSPVGVVDLFVTGNVTDSTVLTSSNSLTIQSTSDIVLDAENNLTGDVSLFATSGGIVFNNGVTHLAGIEAATFDLTARGNVDSSGPIIVTDLTTLTGANTSDFLLDQGGNDLSRVELVSGRNVTLTNNGDSELSVFGAASGVVDIATDTSLLVQGLTADSVLADATGSIDINAVEVMSTIALNSAQNIVFGDISASDINVTAVDNLTFAGDVGIMDSTTDTVKGFTAQAGDAFIVNTGADISSVGGSSAFDLNVAANSVSLAGTITALEADAEFDFASSANVSNTQRFGTLTFGVEEASSVGQVTMTSSGELTSVGDLHLASGGNLLLSHVMSDATVTLSVNGQVIDNNNTAVNITANELVSHSTTGFGTAEDIIETSLAQLSVVNLTNDIAILNDQVLSVDALINQGNILLRNTSGTVTINNNNDAEDYIKELTGTEAALGVIDGGYNTGFVSIFVDDGALIGAGDVNPDRPDLVAFTASVATTEGFGEAGRPLVLWINESITVEGNGFLPIWFENDVADFFTTGDFVDTSFAVSSADLLIEIESIDEVDPAIFNNVLNYEYGELSIRLPSDQLFEDYDDEDDDEDNWVSSI